MPSGKKGQTPANKSLVNFDRPPVNEVVCGVGFRKLDRLNAAHIGLWWSEIHKQFPRSRTTQPIVGYAEDNKLSSLERIMLDGEKDTQIIQIQSTRFYCNWVRAKDEQAYPRYGKVYCTFTDWLKNFGNFLSKHDLGEIEPLEYALTYVNYLPQGEGWQSLQDVQKVLPDIAWRKSRKRQYLAEPSDINFRYVFPINGAPGRLTVTIQQAIRKTDQKPGLRVELATQATSADGLAKHSAETMSEWFLAAREAIVLGFLDLTSETVQLEYWGRKD